MSSLPTNGSERGSVEVRVFQRLSRLRLFKVSFEKFTRAKLQRAKEESVDGPNVCGEPKAEKFPPTLPRAFKSLLGKPVNVESDEPRELIESLGDLLGITDYATNAASFWFLDTLAGQVLRYRDDLDEYYVGILISWLTGEINLLRDRKCSREEFFRELKDIFILAATKISEQGQLPYWEELELHSDTEEEMEGKLSAESLQEPFSQESGKRSSAIDPAFALDILMEATYDMYANELRYSLVYAVFVEPLEVHYYTLPFTLRTPRPVKFADSKTEPFKMQLKKSLQMSDPMEVFEKSKKGKKTKAVLEVPATPAPSLSDEVSLIHDRRFIRPLIEANEAPEIFETHRKTSNIK
ncbi:unnamed protein product [Xylocopa violacea]|uniref:Uncharacterized protein n=1 Tax=Xylocopa violacea TaxID=135666 RepID=A0ABP1NDU8_XYLVO